MLSLFLAARIPAFDRSEIGARSNSASAPRFPGKKTHQVILCSCSYSHWLCSYGKRQEDGVGHTYHVQVMAAPNEGDAPAAKTLALEEANKYCASMNKGLL